MVAACLSFLPASANPASANKALNPDNGASAAAAHVAGLPVYRATGSSLVTATAESMRTCSAANGPDACEIVEINGVPIPPAREIKAPQLLPETPLMMWRYASTQSDVAVVGSIHALKMSLLPLPAPMEEAFNEASHIVVEADVLNRGAVGIDPAWLNEQLALPAGRTIVDMLPEAQAARFESMLAHTGLPFAEVAPLKPAFVAVRLAVTRFGLLGYDPQLGMEIQFIQRANGRPIIEIESVKQQIELLASPSLDVQMEMLEETLVDDAAMVENVSALVAAWYRGDDEALADSFLTGDNRSDGYVAFQYELLDHRNAGMAARIAELLDSQGKYFVLVGAAHLAGDNSVIELLSARGHNGRRVRVDGSEVAVGKGTHPGP